MGSGRNLLNDLRINFNIEEDYRKTKAQKDVKFVLFIDSHSRSVDFVERGKIK